MKLSSPFKRPAKKSVSVKKHKEIISSFICIWVLKKNDLSFKPQNFIVLSQLPVIKQDEELFIDIVYIYF